MKQILSPQKLKRLILISVLIVTFALVPFVFYDEFKFTVIPFFLNFAEHHYFIVAFCILILVMFFLRLTFKKRDKLLSECDLDEQEEYSQLSQFVHNKEIETILFVEKDVLNDSESRNKRMKEILLSMRMGILFRKKVTIFFKAFRGNLKISDLIINKKGDKILLKGGGFIPISSIYKIVLSK